MKLILALLFTYFLISIVEPKTVEEKLNEQDAYCTKMSNVSEVILRARHDGLSSDLAQLAVSDRDEMVQSLVSRAYYKPREFDYLKIKADIERFHKDSHAYCELHYYDIVIRQQ